ncbi:MAG: universal stress protein [Candidatus Bathyarchaeia archaeon]|jgi:nucleotide-binding universal stress UspA family protein
MKRFLVAVDGSEHSKKAVDMAIDMAEKWHSEIILIHVREERTVPKGLEPWMEIEGIRSFGDYSEFVCKSDQFLGEAEARIKAVHGIKVERICVNGDPADEILKAAESYNVDVIVMGSRGLGRFSRSFMGSVSTKVCNHANSTCVTVK